MLFWSFLKKFFLANRLTVIFIGIIAVLFAIIIIPNISAIAEKFGVETRAVLKEQVVVEKNNTNIAVAANKNLVTTNEIFEKTTKNTVTAINAIADKTEANKAKSETIIAKRKTKTEQIKKQKIDPNKIEPKLKIAMQLSGESLERVQASEINALVMVEAYCEINKDDNCKPLTRIL